MPAWNDETVFLIQGKGIGKRHGEVVQCDEISAGDALTEYAIQLVIAHSVYVQRELNAL